MAFNKKLNFLLLFVSFASFAQDQPFYFGNDLSYVNQMEDCGAVFKEGQVPKDPFTIFAERETNLVRVRLWNDPSWWQQPLDQPEGVKPYYNDFEDVKNTIRRARENGMEIMLDIHYSDFWSDPGIQLVPRAWVEVAGNIDALSDSVYSFTTNVLTELNAEGLMPNIVKVGNENNRGFLMDIPTATGYEIQSTVSTSWARHAQLFNAAIRAVRDISKSTEIKPKIALHMSGSLNNQVWNFQNRFINMGVTDFDIIGISYYYAWHGGSIGALESTIRSLTSTFPEFEVMAVETGYLWTQQNFDALGNIITTPDPEYLPVTPEKQLEYMIDYTRAVMKGGGTGVIFWEPAWVSTPCRTPWGIGSSHDHVAFFDPENTNFMDNGGGRWTERQWYEDIDAAKVTFKVDMTGQDVLEGVYLMASFLSDPVLMLQEENNIYYYYDYLLPGTIGTYFFQIGSNVPLRETLPEGCIGEEEGDRFFEMPDQNIIYVHTWSACDPIDEEEDKDRTITFRVDLTGHDRGKGAYITGSFTGFPWQIVPMEYVEDQIYEYSIRLREGRTGAYHFLNDDMPDARENVPEACATWWNTDRGYEVGSQDSSYFFAFGACDDQVVLSASDILENISIFPNPAISQVNIELNQAVSEVRVADISGRRCWQEFLTSDRRSLTIPTEDWKPGIYMIAIYTHQGIYHHKLIIRQ